MVEVCWHIDLSQYYLDNVNLASDVIPTEGRNLFKAYFSLRSKDNF
jgi:hypothetical protein